MKNATSATTRTADPMIRPIRTLGFDKAEGFFFLSSCGSCSFSSFLSESSSFNFSLSCDPWDEPSFSSSVIQILDCHRTRCRDDIGRKRCLTGHRGKLDKRESPCCLRSRQGCKAKLLLHFGSRVVTMKGEDLSTLQVKNIAARDIYCLARWSDSP